jgi:aminoglycoside 3-N-acetyltransferase
VEQLATQWHASGLDTGDTVLVHSSVSRHMKAIKMTNPSATPMVIVESLLDCIGGEGTLLLPLFNFDFSNGRPFDRRSTPSQMGAMTELARGDRRFLRTRHPIYSFAVTGPLAGKFEGLTNVGALSDDGPFGLLRRCGGKIAVIDLDDQNSMTNYHHIEEVMCVDYRYHKNFTGTYTDVDGKVSERTYSLFVWDEKKNVMTDVNRAGEHLWASGAYSGSRPMQDSGMRVIDAQRMFDEVSVLIRAGRAIDYLYSIAVTNGD